MSTAASSSTHNPPPSPSLSTSTSPSMISPTLPHSPETTRQIAEARTFLEASISNIGSTLDASLKTRAQNLHSNSKQVEKQQKEVEKATEGLRKENEKLSAVARDGLKKVKELGNVQNWAEMLERDFLVLQETVRLVNGDGESGSESGSGSWTGSEMSEDGEEGRFKDMGVWPLELDDGALGAAVDEVSGSSSRIGGGLDVGESSKSVLDPTAQMDITMENSTLGLVDSTNQLDDKRSIELPAAADDLQSGAAFAKYADLDAKMAESSIPVNGDEPVLDSSGHADKGKAVEVTEQPTPSQLFESTTFVDSDGDVEMDDSTSEDKGKGKEKEVISDPTSVIVAQQNEVLGSSSSGTAGSGTDPSSASVRTSSSVIS